MIQQEIYQKTLQNVREIIANETGNDFDDILPETLLEEELEIEPTDFTRIIKAINTQLGISLHPKELEADENLETVQDLTMIVCEELELG
jgi:acyl carrier protein